MLDSVTAEDLQRVALKYFVENHATVVELKPQPVNQASQPRRGFGANLLRH
jgi:predicted Zn-dependent peptidase